MQARIYQPAKPATQSGRLKKTYWMVEFEPSARKEPDRLMGWVGSDDTQSQVSLRFPTREAAVAYCERKAIPYAVTEPHHRAFRPKSYAENFIRRV